jgi:hypothetical protein
MSIDDLCSKPNISVPVNKRYPSDVVDKYVVDLKRVLELVTAGSVMPTRTSLVTHFKLTLGMDVTRDTIGQHLKKLQKDGVIWQT